MPIDANKKKTLQQSKEVGGWKHPGGLTLGTCEEEVADAPIREIEVLLGSHQNLGIEMDQKCCTNKQKDIKKGQRTPLR